MYKIVQTNLQKTVNKGTDNKTVAECLINGEIDQSFVKKLVDLPFPTNQAQKASPTEPSYSSQDAIMQFVNAIGPHLTEARLHTITGLLVENEMKDPEVAFRTSRLAKCFVLYELQRHLPQNNEFPEVFLDHVKKHIYPNKQAAEDLCECIYFNFIQSARAFKMDTVVEKYCDKTVLESLKDIDQFADKQISAPSDALKKPNERNQFLKQQVQKGNYSESIGFQHLMDRVKQEEEIKLELKNINCLTELENEIRSFADTLQNENFIETLNQLHHDLSQEIADQVTKGLSKEQIDQSYSVSVAQETTQLLKDLQGIKKSDNEKDEDENKKRKYDRLMEYKNNCQEKIPAGKKLLRSVCAVVGAALGAILGMVGLGMGLAIVGGFYDQLGGVQWLVD